MLLVIIVSAVHSFLLLRDLKGMTDVGPVDDPRYPKTNEEGWWLIVGDTKSNQLLAFNRVSLQRKAKVKLDVAVPSEARKKKFMLCLMCDSYMGCDQEYDVKQASPNDDSGIRIQLIGMENMNESSCMS
ncbi:DExH-box ATP-dependent RNA helicase DExH12-like protein [Tanacetum coccineum]